jgi:hypothetical protein
MAIKCLSSITTASKVFQTGKQPILITCNDMNDYVCKHKHKSIYCNSLFNEYIASCFLKLWSMPIPEFAFIHVKNEHINEFAIENGLEPFSFQGTCFGSYYMQNAGDLNSLYHLIDKKVLQKIDKMIFLKIVLFDIWMANEDRTHNNPNILVAFNKNNWVFQPIDHEYCFNSNSCRDLVQLTQDDSILSLEII